MIWRETRRARSPSLYRSTFRIVETPIRRRGAPPRTRGNAIPRYAHREQHREKGGLIPVMFHLVRPIRVDADAFRLFRSQTGQFRAEVVEV